MSPNPNDLEIGRATDALREQLKRAIFDVGYTARRHAIVPGYDPPLAEHNACMLADRAVFEAFRLGAASAAPAPACTPGACEPLHTLERQVARLEAFALELDPGSVAAVRFRLDLCANGKP